MKCCLGLPILEPGYADSFIISNLTSIRTPPPPPLLLLYMAAFGDAKVIDTQWYRPKRVEWESFYFKSDAGLDRSVHPDNDYGCCTNARRSSLRNRRKGGVREVLRKGHWEMMHVRMRG